MHPAHSATSAHDALPPESQPPRGFLPHCNQPAQIRIGRGMISATCPVCGLREGAWGTNIPFGRQVWNRKARAEGAPNLTVEQDGRQFMIVPIVSFTSWDCCGDRQSPYLHDVPLHYDGATLSFLNLDTSQVVTLSKMPRKGGFFFSVPTPEYSCILDRPQSPTLDPCLAHASITADNWKWTEEVKRVLALYGAEV